MNGAYEQVWYTEKQANNVASVTSGLRSPTKMLKWPTNQDNNKQIKEGISY